MVASKTVPLDLSRGTCCSFLLTTDKWWVPHPCRAAREWAIFRDRLIPTLSLLAKWGAPTTCRLSVRKNSRSLDSSLAAPFYWLPSHLVHSRFNLPQQVRCSG